MTTERNGYEAVNYESVTLNGLRFSYQPITPGCRVALIMPSGRAAMDSDGRRPYAYESVEEALQDADVLFKIHSKGDPRDPTDGRPGLFASLDGHGGIDLYRDGRHFGFSRVPKADDTTFFIDTVNRIAQMAAEIETLRAHRALLRSACELARAAAQDNLSEANYKNEPHLLAALRQCAKALSETSPTPKAADDV